MPDRYLVIGITAVSVIIILAYLTIPQTASNGATTDSDTRLIPINLGLGIGFTTPCSYNIFVQSSVYYAKDCSNGKIAFQSSDASTVINKAINSTTNSQMIYINQGDYIINKTSIELQHGTNIWGVSSGQAVTNGGVGTHIKLANNANINLMEYTKNQLGYFIHLNNLYLDGNFAHNSKGNGTYFNVNASDVEIENTYIDGFPQNCVTILNTFNMRLIGSTFEHCVNDGLFVAKGTDMVVQESKFLTNTNRGVEVGTTSNGVTGFIFEGNYVAGNLNNNYISFNSPNEIIEGNYFQEVANNPTNFHVVLENACSNSQVVGNNFVQAGTTMNGAIDITHSTCNNSMLTGNSIQGTYTNAIQNTGTGTIIRENVGWKTENSGTATIANNTKTIAVNHGLAYTPSIADIYILPQNNGNGCGQYWVSTISSTQFTINCQNNVSPATAFSWSIKRT